MNVNRGFPDPIINTLDFNYSFDVPIDHFVNNLRTITHDCTIRDFVVLNLFHLKEECNPFSFIVGFLTKT